MRRLLLAATLALPAFAHAWGPDGHQTMATIAAALIKGSPAEARVAALLGDIDLPLASVWADCAKGVSPKKDYAYPEPGKYADCAPLETPERITEMADYVRRNDRQCRIGLDEDSCHRQAHYADVALQRSRYLPGFTGTRPDDVAGALRTAILVLQRKPAAGPPHLKSRREALLLLIHLVGDLHQPLHVGTIYLNAHGDRVDPDKSGFDPASFTSGGNDIWVEGGPANAAAGPVKFHTLWDGVPARLKPDRVNAAWLSEARQVRAPSGDPADWPVQWATQSLQQVGAAYAGLKFSARQDHHWTVVLPPGYGARAEAIKRRQLTLAGAHLAQLLQATLAP